MGRSGQTAADLRAVMRSRSLRPPLAAVPAPVKELPPTFDTFLLDETRLAESAARFLAGKPADVVEVTGPNFSDRFRFNWPLQDSNYGDHIYATEDEAIRKATTMLRVSLFGGMIRYIEHPAKQKEIMVKGRTAQADTLAVEYATDGNGITDIFAKDRLRLGAIHGDASAEIAKAAADGFSYRAELHVRDNQLQLTFTPIL